MSTNDDDFDPDDPNSRKEMLRRRLEAATSRPRTVGYGKPPKNRRFKKGQSGNPRGRPRKKKETYDEKTLHECIDIELSETMSVQSDGKMVALTKREIIAKNLMNLAAKGDRKAMDYLRGLDKQNMVNEQKPRGGFLCLQAPMSSNSWEIEMFLKAPSNGLTVEQRNQLSRDFEVFNLDFYRRCGPIPPYLRE